MATKTFFVLSAVVALATCLPGPRSQVPGHVLVRECSSSQDCTARAPYCSKWGYCHGCGGYKCGAVSGGGGGGRDGGSQADVGERGKITQSFRRERVCKFAGKKRRFYNSGKKGNL